MSRGGKLARTLIIAASIVHMVADLYAQSEHVVDTAWPDHARFHTLQALMWIEGLDLVVVVVATQPDAMAVPWSRWALGIGGVVAHGAYFVALWALPLGAPPQGLGAHLPLAAIAVVYALGLVIGLASARPGDA
jgi:hypothetical protein